MFKWFKKHTEDGCEIPDPTPSEISLGIPPPPTLQQRLAAMVGSAEFNRALQKHGLETFEEANDLDPDEDDLFGPTPHQINEDEIHVRSRLDEINAGMVLDLPPDRKRAAAVNLHAIRRKRAAEAKAKTEAPQAEVVADKQGK